MLAIRWHARFTCSGLSGSNRRRMLHVLKLLADDPGVALLYVTHRQDEIDQIGFPNQLRLDA